MKRFYLTLSALLATLLFTACAEQEMPGAGSLSLVISDGSALSTKASDVTELSYEKAVNNLQIFIFEGETLFRYEKISSGLGTLPYSKTYTALKAGAYAVYVVANAADMGDVATEAALQEKVIHLSDCSLTASQGFVMAGTTTTMVGNGSTATASVSLTRFAARVRLVSVTNEVPSTYAQSGAVTVKSVFLINALGTWNLGGTGVASEWVNLGGRASGKQASTTKSDYLSSASQVNPSAYQAQVFRTDGNSVANGVAKNYSDFCLYSFPNAVTADHTGNTATTTDGAFARLVVLATVNGTDWWYPVTLFKDGKGLERNTSYDVRLIIRGTGSSDPNEPVGKGDLTAEVTVNPWSPGAEYSETI
ncbi:MAG: hypothetical protein IKX53_02440 [Bacteroidales bacterium]|nr:hypothetical protein [Bacteroidales bacterium]